jgi:single-strand DNA-binding protein
VSSDKRVSSDKAEKPAAASGMGINSVTLRGRVSVDPMQRTMPSGDELWQVRIVVPREPGDGRRQVDALECSAWSARVRRSVASWRAGDIVEVDGALRRRFFRAGGAAVSRVDVEITAGRLIRRADRA